MKGLVTIIIPVKNSAVFLEACLKSIEKQTYKKIEILVIDSNSSDATSKIVKKFKARLIGLDKKLPQGIFDAPVKRNLGVKYASGEYVYLLDADMELTPNVIWECVKEAETKKLDAIIIGEKSFGEGIWARAKALEKSCYFGDDSVEAPRFYRRSVWNILGGIDEKVGGGGDDWDLFEKLKEKNFRYGRIRNVVLNNEGKLTLSQLFWKRFRYGRQTVKYLSKRPKAGVRSYFPIRSSYLKNWPLFFENPSISLCFVIMRLVEYGGGFLGILYSIIKNE